MYDDEDEGDRPKKKKNTSNEPPKSYGQRKYANGNTKPTGYSSATGESTLRPLFIDTQVVTDKGSSTAPPPPAAPTPAAAPAANVRVNQNTGARAWSPGSSMSGEQVRD